METLQLFSIYWGYLRVPVTSLGAVFCKIILVCYIVCLHSSLSALLFSHIIDGDSVSLDTVTVTGENKEMADTLKGWSTRCCGGRKKARLPCASAAGLAPMWALMLAASIGVAVLQMP